MAAKLVLFALVALVAKLAYATSILSRSNQAPFIVTQDSPTSSNWTVPSHVDATHHLIFQAASGLLQHWSNTAYPNGHSLSPGIIPVGTVMYHGTSTGVPSLAPDWTSFDSEHAILFARGEKGALLAFTAIRPLNVIYFDGNSGANLVTGTLDTQYLIEKREVLLDGEEWKDFERAGALCTWAKKFGVDGFIRMEFDFEAIICDFSAGLELTSTTRIDRPGWKPRSGEHPRVPQPSGPPHILGSHDDDPIFGEPMVAASWYNYIPGLPFVVPDYSKFLTLFDTTLAPSLIPLRRGATRRGHRLLGITREEAGKTMDRLEAVLLDEQSGSGVRWDSLLINVKNRYKDRLDTLNRTLAVISDPIPASVNTTRVFQRIVEQLGVMLESHISLVKPPSPSAINDATYSWAYPVFKRCSTVLTLGLPSTHMTREERVLQEAVQGTVSEICRVLVKSWVATSVILVDESAASLQTIKTDVRDLVDWLGWPEWMRCNPACDDDHVCWMPEWIPIRGWGDTAPGQWRDTNSTTPVCLKKP